MKRLIDLMPSETDLAIAYANLCDLHEPRSTPIAHTGMHACMVCDEVWPCDIAVLLAGFREFRQDSKRLAQATMQLVEATKLATNVIAELSEKDDD